MSKLSVFCADHKTKWYQDDQCTPIKLYVHGFNYGLSGHCIQFWLTSAWLYAITGCYSTEPLTGPVMCRYSGNQRLVQSRVADQWTNDWSSHVSLLREPMTGPVTCRYWSGTYEWSSHVSLITESVTGPVTCRYWGNQWLAQSHVASDGTNDWFSHVSLIKVQSRVAYESRVTRR